MLGVHHAAICTAEVGCSLRLWRDGLGLAALFDHTGDWPQLFPQMPDGGIVELIESAA